MSITLEQRSWLDELGTLTRQPAPPTVEDDDAAMPDAAALRDGAVGFPGGKVVDELIDILTRRIRTEITIKNESAATLRLVDGSVTLKKPGLSQFEPSPPAEIAPGEKVSFAVENRRVVAPTSGSVRYAAVSEAEPKPVISIAWERPVVGKRRRDKQIGADPDDGRFSLQAVENGDDFSFFIAGGSVRPDPQDPADDPTHDPAVDPPHDPVEPPVQPPAAVDAQASCLITVTNTTPHTLMLADSGHERGDFMLLVPTSVPPGATVSFASVETPHAADHGCKGFVVWEVGSPMVAVWRIEWDNPEGAKNTTDATLTPQTAGLRSVDQIGQGEENVPVMFTLSGGTAGGDDSDDDGVETDDTDDTGDDDNTDPPPPATGFEPPVEATQPTLRRGDDNADGWVEYAQEMLVFHLDSDLAVDGDFGAATERAVKAFQRRKGLAVDGIIGNQTWAALRESSPQAPGTDGRDPQSYVEQGAEARWALESERNNLWLADEDSYLLVFVSVGEAPVDPAAVATIRVAPPGGTPAIVRLALGQAEAADGGRLRVLKIERFRATFGSLPADAPVEGYRVEAYLPQELGGDYYAANVRSEL